MHTVIIAVAVASGIAAAGAAMPSPRSQEQVNVLRTSLSCTTSQTQEYPSSMQGPKGCAAVYSPYLDVQFPADSR
jgi:hypothetical protein